MSVGVIGLGKHSRNRLIPRLRSNSLTQISFLATRDWRRQLSSDVQAVVVAVPYSIQAQVALECLRRGHHVFCESPAALTLSEARTLKKTAEKHNREFRVNYQLRFEPKLAQLKLLMATQDSWLLVASFPAFHHLCDLVLEIAPTPVYRVCFIGESEEMEIIFQDGNQAILSLTEEVSSLSLRLFNGLQKSLFKFEERKTEQWYEMLISASYENFISSIQEGKGKVDNLSDTVDLYNRCLRAKTIGRFLLNRNQHC